MADSIPHTFTSSLPEKKMLLKYLPISAHLATQSINQCQTVLIAGHIHTLVNKLGAHRKSNEKVNDTVPQETV